MRIMRLFNLRNEDSRVGFFLHINDVLDEVLDVEKYINLWIFIIHIDELSTFNEKYFVLGN